MTPAVEGEFKEIERKAFERYLLDLARGWAAEEERLHLENRGKELNVQVLQIDLVGEYPHTAFDIRCRHRANGESTKHFTIYQTPGWFDGDGKRLVSPERIVGDILMLARGG